MKTFWHFGLGLLVTVLMVNGSPAHSGTFRFGAGLNYLQQEFPGKFLANGRYLAANGVLFDPALGAQQVIAATGPHGQKPAAPDVPE